MITKLNKLSLKNGSSETLLETTDFIFSIAYCEKTNGIFYSNFTSNRIYMLSLENKNPILYKRDDIYAPKSICISEGHENLFFEDDMRGISGFHVTGRPVFSCASVSAKLELESHINSRNIGTKSRIINNNGEIDYLNLIHGKIEPEEVRTKVNCITFSDRIHVVYVSRAKKHLISFINNSGKIFNLLGSGRADFSMSTDQHNISFNCPTGLCFTDNNLFVADTNNHVVRCFSKNKTWIELPLIGIPTKDGEQDGSYNKAMFKFPTEICYFKKNMFIIDNGNKIRRIDTDKKEVTTVYSTSNFIKSITCDQENVYFTEF